MGVDDTDQLIALAKAGDKSAQQMLLTRHQDRLLRMIASMMDARLCQRVDASDILQDAMTRAIRKFPDYLRQQPVSLYPWLRQIARDLLIEIHRRHLQAECRSVLKEDHADFHFSDQSAIDLAGRLVSRDPSPSKCAAQHEMVQRVKVAMRQLTPEDRELLLMSFVERLHTREIAEILSVSVVTVRSRLRRALEKLTHFVGG